MNAWDSTRVARISDVSTLTGMLGGLPNEGRDDMKIEIRKVEPVKSTHILEDWLF
jgi:hypothetical protein